MVKIICLIIMLICTLTLLISEICDAYRLRKKINRWHRDRYKEYKIKR